MNKSIALVIGVLFLLGLVAIAFSNYLAFSPDTPRIIAVTQQYQSGTIELENVSRTGNTIKFSVINHWTKAYWDYVFHNASGDTIIDTNGDPISCNSRPHTYISTNETVNMECEDDGTGVYFSDPGGFNKQVKPPIISVCILYGDVRYGPKRQSCSTLP